MKKATSTKSGKKPAKKQEVKKSAGKKKTAKKVKARKTKVEQGLVVVTNPTNPSQQFLVASELADDDAIEGELMGKAMESFVYSFSEGGKTVTGLTVAGTNETARQLTRKKDSGYKIRIIPESIKIEHNIEMGGELGINVYLLAENMLTGETAIGAKFEPYEKRGKNGKYKNTFSLEKAVSKAERNAKRKLIPEKIVIEMIKKFVRGNKVHEIGEHRAALYAPAEETPRTSEPEINYLARWLTILAKEAQIGHKNINKSDLEKMIALHNEYTGAGLKTLRVSQAVAKIQLNSFLNSPNMMNK